MGEHGGHHHLPEGEHGSGLNRLVALFIAIVAVLSAIIGHEAEEIANKALLYKNEAVLKKTEASNQWSYYQAVSTKSHLMELAMTLVPADKQAPFADKIDKYNKQKDEIQARANKLEVAATAANDKSVALREPRLNLMYALALLQVAIGVGSVTVLSGQRWLFAVSVAGCLAGLGFASYALLLH